MVLLSSYRVTAVYKYFAWCGVSCGTHFISAANSKPLGYLVGYLFAIALLAMNGGPGPIALYHQHDRWPLCNPLLCFTLLYNAISTPYLEHELPVQHMSSRHHLTFLYTMHLRIVVLQLQLQPQLTVPS
jgi:hypothetical protein